MDANQHLAKRGLCKWLICAPINHALPVEQRHNKIDPLSRLNAIEAANFMMRRPAKIIPVTYVTAGAVKFQPQHFKCLLHPVSKNPRAVVSGRRPNLPFEALTQNVAQLCRLGSAKDTRAPLLFQKSAKNAMRAGNYGGPDLFGADRFRRQAKIVNQPQCGLELTPPGGALTA